MSPLLRDPVKTIRSAGRVTYALLNNIPLPKDEVMTLLDAGVNICEMSIDCCRVRAAAQGDIVITVH